MCCAGAERAGMREYFAAAPVDAMKVPALQLEHALAPDAEYFPLTQLVHNKTVVPPVTAENFPAKHEIPICDYVFICDELANTTRNEG
jgi:hypothetical protein